MTSVGYFGVFWGFGLERRGIMFGFAWLVASSVRGIVGCLLLLSVAVHALQPRLFAAYVRAFFGAFRTDVSFYPEIVVT